MRSHYNSTAPIYSRLLHNPYSLGSRRELWVIREYGLSDHHHVRENQLGSQENVWVIREYEL